MNSGEPWRLGHRPALDGLRGVAILLVMAAHTAAPESSLSVGGTAGVTMFFTLSGFLITALLIGERDHLGRIHFGAFYRRRALRLLPALTVVVVVVTALGLFVNDYSTGIGALAALGYVANWVQGFGGNLGALGHTWSLSIEEQFYVGWPLVLLVAMRLRHWRGVLYSGIAAVWCYATVARWVLWDHERGAARVYNGTDVRVDALLVGCALAVWMTSRPESRTASRLRTDVTLLAVITFLFSTSSVLFDYLLVPAWLPIVVVVVIHRVVAAGYAGLLVHPVLQRIGQRSYALYLWHVPILYLFERSSLPHWSVVVLAYSASWATTEASWRWVELPFLRMKDRRPARSGGVVMGVGARV